MSNFKTALIACTDFETTGLDPLEHEIIEIGLVVAEQPTLKVVAELDLKVEPHRLHTANPNALEINGYNERDWEGAVTPVEAAHRYAELVPGAMLLAHNVTFERSFLWALFDRVGVQDPMDYHRLDLFSLAWAKLHGTSLEKFNLNEVAAYLNLPKEPEPHRAINGARLALDVYRALVKL